MAQFKDFSDRDWELAPHYSSGAIVPGFVGLEFGKLLELVESQEIEGAFRKTHDNTFGKAPVLVDGLPSALYLLETKTADEFSPNHNTADHEIVVVLDGTLRFAHNDGSDRPVATNFDNTFSPGEVLQFHNDTVSLQAVGIFNPARAVALALFRDDNPDIQFGML